jgi:hypothetical protein
MTKTTGVGAEPQGRHRLEGRNEIDNYPSQNAKSEARPLHHRK